jgi:hypothetical protein
VNVIPFLLEHGANLNAKVKFYLQRDYTGDSIVNTLITGCHSIGDRISI